MRRLKKSRRRIWLWAAVSSTILIGEAWFFGVSSPKDVQAYVLMSRECHPVWRELALKRIGAGDSVDSLVEQAPPGHVEQVGRFQQLEYYQSPGPDLNFTGITLISRDRRLVSGFAWSCTWQHVFFDVMTDAERDEFEGALQQQLDERRARRGD